MPLTSTNPLTGETWQSYEEISPDELETKLALAAQTFVSYRQTSLQDRARWLHRAADLLDERQEDLAHLMVLEMGKLIQAARDEAAKCAACCRFYAENAANFVADEIVQTKAKKSLVRYQPLGPVLAIMPWNFPFWQVFRFAAPALMAGNVGLLKHASNVPGCALAIETILRDAGFPGGAFQTLLLGSQRAEKLLDDPRIAAATLTGSEGAGAKIAAAAGHNLKKVVLELGGSDPFIVLPSADLEKAIETAVKARLLNNGQSCIASKRFIVHQDLYEEFERGFVKIMRAITIGDPLDKTTELGPLATAAIRDDLHQQVEKSVASGAKLLCGGHIIDGLGNFYQPTVLADIPEDSPAFHEVFFGPVANLFRVRDLDEAIRIANATSFGLGASAWTHDEAEIERLTTEIEAGSVFINAMVASNPQLPFGGIKKSGYGRELSHFGLREFVNIKTVWIEN